MKQACQPRAADTYRANRKQTRQERLAERGLKQLQRQQLPRFLVGIRMIGQNPQAVRTSPLDAVTKIKMRMRERESGGRWTGDAVKGAQIRTIVG